MTKSRRKADKKNFDDLGVFLMLLFFGGVLGGLVYLIIGTFNTSLKFVPVGITMVLLGVALVWLVLHCNARSHRTRIRYLESHSYKSSDDNLGYFGLMMLPLTDGGVMSGAANWGSHDAGYSSSGYDTSGTFDGGGTVDGGGGSSDSGGSF